MTHGILPKIQKTAAQRKRVTSSRKPKHRAIPQTTQLSERLLQMRETVKYSISKLSGTSSWTGLSCSLPLLHWV